MALGKPILPVIECMHRRMDLLLPFAIPLSQRLVPLVPLSAVTVDESAKRKNDEQTAEGTMAKFSSKEICEKKDGVIIGIIILMEIVCVYNSKS
ncbi:hypothetical protein chiPu_0018525 [Chiloscyllium punctatum]|uniref:Uncharacterized protein n=1 Tax=Chiloscyllium punctatum TaxID=137246 RepID=A0A401RNK7_CHIPU|nr:hypothetical protein [Chiloscyllium punctatum]